MHAALIILMLQAGCIPVGAGLSGTVVVPNAGLAFHVWIYPEMNPRPEQEALPDLDEQVVPKDAERNQAPSRGRTF